MALASIVLPTPGRPRSGGGPRPRGPRGPVGSDDACPERPSRRCPRSGGTGPRTPPSPAGAFPKLHGHLPRANVHGTRRDLSRSTGRERHEVPETRGDREGCRGRVRIGPGGDAPRGPCSQLQASRPGRSSGVADYIACDPYGEAHAERACGHRRLLTMGRALVLNVTDVPLAVVPARRAVVLVLKDKAEVVESNGAIFRSETRRDRRPLGRAPASLRPRAVPRPRARSPGAPCSRATIQLPVLRGERGEPRPRRARGRAAVCTCGRTSSPPAGGATRRRWTARPQEAGYRLARPPFAPSDGFRLTLGQPRARLGRLPDLSLARRARDPRRDPPRSSRDAPASIAASNSSSSGLPPLTAVER